MGLDIKIDIDMRDLQMQFDRLSEKQIKSSIRRSLRRTIVSVRTEAIKDIRKTYKIKESRLAKRHIWLEKSNSGLSGAVAFSKNPIPMIEFVKGNKDVIKQKGIPVAKRRKLRMEVAKGKTFVMQHAFIQRKMSKQVFKGRRGMGFKKQGIVSVGSMVQKPSLGDRLRRVAMERFQKTLVQDLSARIKGYVKG